MISRPDLEVEKELMLRVAKGSEPATRKLAADYLGYVLTLAFRIVGNCHDAEEIAQETFLKLFKQAKSWDARARISTWLYRVTYNASIDLLRSKKRHLTYELKEFMIYDGEEVSFLPEGIEELEEAMSKLSVKHRLALTIYYFEEKKIQEAAAIMTLKEDAFESLLRRARKKLKNILEGMDIEGKSDESKKERNFIDRKDRRNAFQISLFY